MEQTRYGFSATGQTGQKEKLTLEEQLESLDNTRYTLSVLQNIPLQYFDDYTIKEFHKIYDKYVEVNAKKKNKSFTREPKKKELEIAEKIRQQIRDKHGKRSA